MTNQTAFLRHLGALFTTFARQTDLSPEETALAQELVTRFASWKEAGSRWSSRGIDDFLSVEKHVISEILSRFPNLTASDKAVISVKQFVEQTPFNQAKVYLHGYLLALKNDGCSRSTVRNYRSDISQFIDYHSTNDLKKLLTKPKLDSFERYQRQKGLKESSIDRKFASIAQFSHWSADQGLIDHDPLAVPNIEPKLAASVPATTPTAHNKPAETDSNVLPRLSKYVDRTNRPAGFQTTAQTSPIAFQKTTQTSPTLSDATNSTTCPTPNTASKNSRSSVLSSISQNVHRSFLTYVNFALVLLLFFGLGWLGYNQFYRNVDQPLAFPSSPTRPNRVLSFQGRLTDTAQNPITTATDMRFRIYDSGPSIVGGTELWDSGTCSIDPDQDGIFSTTLGDACGTEISNDVFSENANTWLQVQVDTETLSPRQPIEAVAYALNSETIQGFPVNASESATRDTVLVMNSSGEVVLGEDSPSLVSDTGQFTIQGETIRIETETGGNGDVIISPDGDGSVLLEKYLYAPGATLSATYAESIVLQLQAGPSGTGDLTQWLNDSGTVLSVIDSNGQIGIGTDTPAAITESFGTSEQLRLSYDDSNSSSFTTNSSGDLTIAPTGNDTTIDGDIIIGSSGTTTFNTVEYTWPGGDGSSGYILSTNGSGSLSWADPASLTATSTYWIQSNGSLYPKNSTVDFFVGGQATDSAKFAVLNMDDNASGVPTATLSGSVAGAALSIDGDGTLQTSLNRSLILNPTGGNVGIGTTAPFSGSKLHVAGGNIGINQSYGLVSATIDRNIITQPDSDSINIGDATAGGWTDINLYTLGGLGLSVSSTNNTVYAPGVVGIGTTTPDADLEIGNGAGGSIDGTNDLLVQDDIEVDDDVFIDDALTVAGTTTFNSVTYTWPGADGLSSYVLTTNGSGTLSWSDPAGLGGSSGNWAINASTGVIHPINETLDVLVGGTTTASATIRLGRNGDAEFDINTLVVDAANNEVGIGTSTMDARLHVFNGSAGAVTASSNSVGVFENNADAYLSLLTPNANERGLLFGEASDNDAGSIIYNDALTADGLQFRVDGNSIAAAINSSENLGVGTTTIGARVHSLSTTEQLRLGYDASNYAQFIVNSTGDIDITPTGGDLTVSGDFIVDTGTTTFNTVEYTWPGADGSGGYVLSTNGSGTLSWADPAALTATSTYWLQTNGTLYPKNSTVDFFVGGQATASAKFAVLNLNSGTPVASVSAGTSGAAYLTADGELQATALQNLTLGGSTTGRIAVADSVLPTTDDTYNLGSSTNRFADLYLGPSTLSIGTDGNDYNMSFDTTGVGTLVFNDAGDDTDLRIEGASEANLLFVDASAETVGVGTSSPIARFESRATTEQLRLGYDASNFAQFVVNSAGDINITPSGGDLTISGDLIVDGGTTTFNTVEYTWPGTDGLADYVLTTNGSGTLSWQNVSAVSSGGNWTLSASNGTIYPINETVDLLVGGTTTASAKFALTGINSGTPTATLSGSVTGAAVYLDGNGTLQTSLNRSLALNPSGGNVGVGTSNPSEVFDVGGDFMVDSDGYIGISTTPRPNDETLVAMQRNSGAVDWVQTTIENTKTSGAAGYRVDSNTTAYWNFVVHNSGFSGTLFGQTRAGSPMMYAGNGPATIGTVDNYDLYFGTNNATRLTIESGGDVGVGTTTPDARLNAQSTSEQLRLNYNDSNYTQFIVNSSGDIDLTPSGGDLTISGDLIVDTGTTTFNTVEYTWPASAAAANDYVLTSTTGGSLEWQDVANLVTGSGAGGKWVISAANGTLYPINTTLDVLVGGTTTASAGVRLGRDGSSNFDTDTLIVDAPNDRVGIGTTTPDSRLHILGTNAQTGGLTFESSVGTADRLALYPTGNDSFNIKKLSASSALNFLDSSDNAEVVIDSAGYVGIGTTSPVSQLQVVSNATVGGRGITTSQHTTDDASALANFYKSRGSSSTPTTVVDGDYLGLFTYQPYVSTSNYIPTANFGARVNGTVTGTSAPTDLFFATSTVEDQNPFLNNTVRLLIESTGYIGVGTTDPGSLLEVGDATVNFVDGSNDAIFADDIEIDDDLFVGDDLTVGGNNTTINSVAYTWPGSAAAANNYVLTSTTGGVLSWTDVTTLVSGGGSSNWTLNSTDGTIYPINTTLDVLVGGTTSASAEIVLSPTGDASFDGQLAVSGVGYDDAVDTSGVFLGEVSGNTSAPIEFLSSNLNFGYGWNVESRDLGATDITLTFSHRANSPTWTDFMSLSNGNGGELGLGTTNPGATLDVRGSAIFNELGADNDFRIEGDAEANLFLVDASSDRIGIGTSTPNVTLEVIGDARLDGGQLTIGGVGYDDAVDATGIFLGEVSGNTSAPIEFLSSNTGAGYGWNVESRDLSASNIPLVFSHRSNSGTWTDFMAINTENGGELGLGTTNPGATLDVRGSAIFNELGADNDFRIEGDAEANLFLVDASSDRIGIGTSTPNVTLEVIGDARLDGGQLTIGGVGYDDAVDTSGVFLGEVSGNTSAPIEFLSSNLNFGYGWNVESRDLGATDITLTFSHRANSPTWTDFMSLSNGNGGELGLGTTNPGATLDVRGSAIFNELGADNDFRIEGDAEANLFFVNAGSDQVGIGDSDPDARLDITSTAAQLRLAYNTTDTAYSSFQTGSNGNLTIDVSGNSLILANGDALNIGGLTNVDYNALSDVGTTSNGLASDDDLYIEGDLEVDGTVYFDSGSTTINGVGYTWPGSAAAANDYVLTSTTGGVLSWTDVSTLVSGGSSNWTLNSGDGTMYPINTTVDTLIGGNSTASATLRFTPAGEIILAEGFETSRIFFTDDTSIDELSFDVSNDGDVDAFFSDQSRLYLPGESAGYTAGVYFGTHPSSLESSEITHSATGLDIGSTEQIDIDSDDTTALGGVVINGDGGNTDFRVQTDNDSFTLFVDGGSDEVGIGTSSPAAKLDIREASGTQLRLATGGSDRTDFTVDSNGVTVNITTGTINDGTFTLANNDRINIGGVNGLDYNAIADSGTASNGLDSDDDLWIEGDLEIDGTVYIDSGNTTINSVAYTWPGSVAAANDYVLTSTTGGVLSWTDVTTLVSGGGSSNWTLSSGDGTIYPINETLDLFVGGTSTSSAAFSVLNVDTGTPTASVSAGTESLVLSGDGSIQAVRNNNLTLGGSTTGRIAVADSVLPTADDTYALGSSTNRFADLYLGPSTLSIGTDGNDYNMSFDTAGVGTLVFNDAGDDTDLRIEGASEANLLFVDASTNRIGIGSSSPGYPLDISGAMRASGEVISTSANAFRMIQGSYGSFFRNDGSDTFLLLTDSADQYGSFNSFRPFAVDNATGDVTLGTGSDLFIDDSTNRVGIGDITPSYALDVNGDAQFQGGNVIISGTEQQALEFAGLGSWYIGTLSNIDPLINFDGNDYLLFDRSADEFLFRTGGVTRFEIEGDGDFLGQRFVDTSSDLYYIDPANTGTSISINGNIVSNGAFEITSNGNNDIDIDAGTGTVSIGGGTGKFDAGTVDPPYYVNGVSYATFLSGMIGVREEIAQIATLQPTSKPGLYKHEVDFDNAPEGTEMWLFSRITDIDAEMNNLVVLANAQDGSLVSYKKDLANRKLIFFGSEPTEISFRLTAPRFDHEQWDIVRPEQDGTGFRPDEYILGNAPAGATPVSDDDLLTELLTQDDMTLSELGLLEINGIEAGDTTVVRSGTAIESLAAFSDAVIGTVRTGIANTGKLIASISIQAPETQTDLISPLAGDDITVTLADSSEAGDGTAGQLTIENEAGDTVATIDGDGDASFAGLLEAQELDVSGNVNVTGTATANQLEANSIEADQITTTDLDATSSRIAALEAGMAQLDNVRAQTAELVTATISGTLYATNIDGFNDKVGDALQEPSLLQKLLDEQDENPEEATIARLVEVIETDGYSATGSGSLNKSLSDLALDTTDLSIGAEAAFINRYFEVNGDAFVGGSLGIENTILVGEGMQIASGIIQQNATDANPNPLLEIQPSGIGSISLLAGVVTISDSGQVAITGDLTVDGDVTVEETLLTDLLQPTEFGNPFQVQVAGVATESGEVRKSRFEIVDEAGSPVATISAEGKAEFAGGIGVDNEDLSGSGDSEVTSNKTSGKAKIANATNEVTIKSELITDDTLIYVTPIGSTGNQVLFVKSQTPEDPETGDKEGQFVVGFDNPTSDDVNFNWWIVN